MAHLVIVCLVFQKLADFVYYEVVVGTHKFDGSCAECFGTLGGVAHHENRFSKARGFFLDSARVGEDDSGFLHQIDELQILERFDEEEVLVCGEVFAEDFVDRLAHVGIEVHRIHEVNFGIFLAEVFHCRYHRDEAISEVLASVAGDEDKLFAIV